MNLLVSVSNKRYSVWIFGFLTFASVMVMALYRGMSMPQVNNIFANSLWKSNPGRFWSNNVSVSNNETYKVVCMIFTRVSNWETRGKAVRTTWAKRCHKAIFFYSKVANCNTHSICNYSSAVGLDVPDGRDHLTAKSFTGLSYSYAKYGEEADYFLKADDDTYLIAENLQEILSRLSSKPLLYIGRTINNILPKGYNSGGAGYIISKKAAQLLHENRTQFPSECHADGGYEDVEMGRCLAKFGVYPENEIDVTGRLIFHSDNPFRVFQNDPVSGAYYINLNGVEFGNKKTITEGGFMLSSKTVTMHYVTPPEMYMFEFLLYHLDRKRGSTVTPRQSTNSTPS